MFQMTYHPYKATSSVFAGGGTFASYAHYSFDIDYADGVKVNGLENHATESWGGRSGYRHTAAKRDRKCRVYISSDTRWTVLEDLMNRFRRPHDIWKPYAVDVLTRLGVFTTKMSWNQKAGCSCGCSPAFVADAPELRGWELWITVPNLDTVDESLPARELVFA